MRILNGGKVHILMSADHMIPGINVFNAVCNLEQINTFATTTV